MNVLIKISQFNSPYSGFNYNDTLGHSDFQDFFVISIDNFSDNNLINQILRLITENEKIIIFLDMDIDATTGNLLSLLRKSIRYKRKIQIIFSGQNNQLEKLIKPFGKSIYKETLSEEYLKELIKIDQ